MLDGRVAVVSGAATGLGGAIAAEFARAGAEGMVLDIAEFTNTIPAGWLAAHAGISDESALLRSIEALRDRFGRIDIVVANAGIVPPWRETESLEFDKWQRVFEVNVRGVAATINTSVPLMKQCGGSIIAMGSLNSRQVTAF